MRTLTNRRPAPTDAGRPRFTPEHLQLLSDTRLHSLADGKDAGEPAGAPSPLARLASRELRRRHGAPRRPAA